MIQTSPTLLTTTNHSSTAQTFHLYLSNILTNMPFQQSLLVALLVVSAVLGRSLVDLNAGQATFCTVEVYQLLEIRTTDRSK
ncbi:hypothetical protein H4Q26_009841 [Puccinia striiformis f. sp. tritici PST-130]|nr:hypothetical protein H4Q26_009841 [Puccinia striiformis f. sp. tritici PST-130]